MSHSKKGETLSLFSFSKDGVVAVVFAYNRGHAATLIGKELKSRGMVLQNEDPITKIEPENKKGCVVILRP